MVRLDIQDHTNTTTFCSPIPARSRRIAILQAIEHGLRQPAVRHSAPAADSRPTWRGRLASQKWPFRELRPLKAEVKPEAVELILNSTSAVRCTGKDQYAECGSAYISTPARLCVAFATTACRGKNLHCIHCIRSRPVTSADSSCCELRPEDHVGPVIRRIIGAGREETRGRRPTIAIDTVATRGGT